MILKCIAIDDEPLALKLLKDYIQRIPDLQLVNVFEDAVLALEFLEKGEVDLVFLDIEMPDISGIDLVRSLNTKPLIVFTTAYRDFAFEGFELEALDYLLKPIAFHRFSKAVEKAVQYYKSKPKEDSTCFFVYSEYRVVRVDFDEIEYIESLKDYIKIHLSGAKPVLTLMTLKKVLERLPPEKFKQIHRSYVAPVAKVKSVSSRKVELFSSVELPVSKTYSGFIKDWLKS